MKDDKSMKADWILGSGGGVGVSSAPQMAEPYRPLLPGQGRPWSPNTGLSISVGASSLGPHSLPLAAWFSHLGGQSSALLVPSAPTPGRPYKDGALGMFINKALALRHWQSCRRARRASVSNLEFGLGLPM